MLFNLSHRFINTIIVIGLLIAFSENSASAQDTKSTNTQTAITHGIEIILSMQEGEEKDQWP